MRFFKAGKWDTIHFVVVGVVENPFAEWTHTNNLKIVLKIVYIKEIQCESSNYLSANLSNGNVFSHFVLLCVIYFHLPRKRNETRGQPKLITFVCGQMDVDKFLSLTLLLIYICTRCLWHCITPPASCTFLVRFNNRETSANSETL